MEREQELAIDRLSLIGGGFATVNPSSDVVEVQIPPKARRFSVNEDGSALDHSTGELHRYVGEGHEFVPPIPSAAPWYDPSSDDRP